MLTIVMYGDTHAYFLQSLIRKCIYREKYTSLVLKHCSDLKILPDLVVSSDSLDYCQPPMKRVDNGPRGYYDPTWIIDKPYPGQCVENCLAVPHSHYDSKSKRSLSVESDMFPMYANESSSKSM